VRRPWGWLLLEVSGDRALDLVEAQLLAPLLLQANRGVEASEPGSGDGGVANSSCSWSIRVDWAPALLLPTAKARI
jgi:hypothetical protein